MLWISDLCLNKNSIPIQEIYLRICYILEEIDYYNLHTAEKLIKVVEEYQEDIVSWLQKMERMYFTKGFLRYTDCFGNERNKHIMQLTIVDLCNMLQNKINLLTECNEIAHLEAYKFILRMAKASLPTEISDKNNKSK